MTNHVVALAERIIAIDWTVTFTRSHSRAYLMKEYLRRAAWWVKATDAVGFPFPDIAAAVNPLVRADSTVLDLVSHHLDGQLQGVPVQRACANALHFAALFDASVALPGDMPDPFEPLLLMFERGGGFRMSGGGLIDVDSFGIRPGTVEENLQAEPYTQLDTASLDALDAG